MAKNGRVKVEELRDEFNENLERFGTEFKAQLDEIREVVQLQFEDVATSIREEADKAGLDKDARESIETVLNNLEKRVNDLDTAKLEEIEEELTEEARKHVWRNLLIVLVVGLIIGYFLNNRD